MILMQPSVLFGKRCKSDCDVSGVSLSREAHGPALTLNITHPGKHDISVDVAPSLPSNLPVTSNCWPRPDCLIYLYVNENKAVCTFPKALALIEGPAGINRDTTNFRL